MNERKPAPNHWDKKGGSDKKYHTIKKAVMSSKKRNNNMNLYASNHIASKFIKQKRP